MKIILKKVTVLPFFIYTYYMPTNPGDFRIVNKSMKLKEDLKNIASHLGIPCGTWLRSELIKLRDSFPEHMKRPQSKD